MAITVKPKTLATGGPYTPTGELGPTEWNDGHEIELASQRVLGRLSSSAGDAEELKGMWVEVSRAVADDDASIDFTGIDSSADEWKVLIINWLPVDTSALRIRTSSNGGSTYDSGATDYVYATIEGYQNVNGPDTGVGMFSEKGSAINITPFAQSNPTDYSGTNAEITFFLPSSGNYSEIRHESAGSYDDSPDLYIFRYSGVGRRLSATAFNAVRFAAESGNIESGTFVLLKRLK
jgi:hypothetical protein